jgi:hypothetical protein
MWQGLSRGPLRSLILIHDDVLIANLLQLFSQSKAQTANRFSKQSCALLKTQLILVKAVESEV